jgi:hypothetical protein
MRVTAALRLEIRRDVMCLLGATASGCDVVQTRSSLWVNQVPGSHRLRW